MLFPGVGTDAPKSRDRSRSPVASRPYADEATRDQVSPEEWTRLTGVLALAVVAVAVVVGLMAFMAAVLAQS